VKGAIAVLAVCALAALVSAALWQLVRALAGWRDAAGEHVAGTRRELEASAHQQALRDDKARLLQHLRELRFDRDTGKLGDDDYRQLREQYEREAAVVLEQLDALPAHHAPRVGAVEGEAG
jgi:hypothetical protein